MRVIGYAAFGATAWCGAEVVAAGDALVVTTARATAVERPEPGCGTEGGNEGKEEDGGPMGKGEKLELGARRNGNGRRG